MEAVDVRNAQLRDGTFIARVGAWTGMTEGQVYTAVLAVAVAMAAAFHGVPPTLRDLAPTAPVAIASSPEAAPPVIGRDGAPAPVQEAPATPISPLTPPPPPRLAAAPLAPESAPTPAAPPLASAAAVVLASAPEEAEITGAYSDDERHALLSQADDAGAVLTLVSRDGGVVTYELDDLVRPTGLLLDGGSALVTDATTGVATVDLETGKIRASQALPDLLPCVLTMAPVDCEPGIIDDAPAAVAVVVHPDVGVLVADSAQSTIFLLDVTGEAAPTVWTQLDDAGDPTTGLRPVALAVAADGELLVLVTTNGENPQSLLRIEVGANGAAGKVTDVASFAADATATGLATDDAGNTYVTLAGSGAIAVLDKHGAVSTPLTDDLITAPTAIAWDDVDGRLVVADDPEDRPGRLIGLPIPTDD